MCIETTRYPGVASNRMLKNPSSLSFRGAAGDEESRPDQIGVSRARFLASLGMTTLANVFQHPAKWTKVEPGER